MGAYACYFHKKIFFIDGTVEGTPTDLTIYIDTNYSHDHTYYGNGCSVEDYPQGELGSKTPCSTRIVRSIDNEDQKNGTYYHFQAATSGSGAAITAENTNSPDTFCPLGWQLPYSGTGGDYYNKSRSWTFLFNSYGIQNNTAGGTAINSYPLSYILSGRTDWDTSRLYIQTKNAEMWSSTVGGSTAYRLDLFSTGFTMPSAPDKLKGQTLRCDFNISNLE